MSNSPRFKYPFFLIAFALLVSGSSMFFSCKQTTTSYKDSIILTGNQVADGKALAAKHCSTCHQLVPVNALNKDVWQYHTLPSMAKYLGISTYGDDYFKRDRAANIGLSIDEWADIVAYYKAAAPLSLDSQKRPEPLLNDWAGFVLKKPNSIPGSKRVFTTVVKVDTLNHAIYSSDMATSKLYQWNARLAGAEIATLPSAAVDIQFSKDAADRNLTLACVGRLEPMDYPNGKLVLLKPGKTSATVSNIETDLSRPVFSAAADFDKNGLIDYVICAQGNIKGHVFWMKQNADHTFTREVIKDQPGSVQATVGDYNHDGWPDVMVLFGSGDEGLTLFLNNHKGGFTERALLKFPPVYGSSSFQIADVNHDGKPDIIYTAGYNYRNSRVLKPYHGLYIFLNHGNWKLKQSYFYPVNGCTKAMAADFDGDGDIDIATSAFFADLKNQPAESCIYFEQDKNMHFKLHTIPVSKYGRWFTMDVNDWNGDGKPDIVLGNYSSGLSIEANTNAANNYTMPFIVLENHAGK